MTSTAPVTSERRRVKVYELKNNDWFDRGTGYCVGTEVNSAGVSDPRLCVQSEDDPNMMLMESRISKDDGFQKQQDTLIVWTETNGIDMALSFQEAEGCTATWEFLTQSQRRLLAVAPTDGISHDMGDDSNPALLPSPELSNLADVENIMRSASATAQGRDALAKFVMAPEHLYIPKLVPLVQLAEELEDLPDLHRLCNIMKILILLNDNAVIEYVVRDDIILGVVGALEYDPDFPSHKANHRQYLSDETKFKQVVAIENPDIRKKIHYTYRLQYLKDVVLARILDDPTFSVLNSLIFFHQVDIVNHIQANATFLHQLFAIFDPREQDSQRKQDAVLFIQNCCSVAKNIQAQSRQQLFQNFINGGLLNVVTFALKHNEASVRVAGTDVLVALIDHDPAMMRTYIFKAINEKTKPLTDTLIELLLVEVDLGVKAQMSDAIKVLLDSTANPTSMDMLGRTNGDFIGKMQNRSAVPTTPQTEAFIQNFYDESAMKLFAPLKALEHRKTLSDLTIDEASLFEHLIGILCCFIRQHAFRSKFFTLSEGLHCRVAQLLSSPRKHLKLSELYSDPLSAMSNFLVALKWFRTCILLRDEYHNRHIMQHQLFGPIVDLIEETMPRDNLLNSVCLELFTFIITEGVKQLIDHIVETYRPRLMAITYVDLFQRLVHRYDQMHYVPPATENSFSTQAAETPNRSVLETSARWNGGLKELDADEEAYYNTSDNEDDDENMLPVATVPSSLATVPLLRLKPLVAYPEDDDDDPMDLLSSASESRPAVASPPVVPSQPALQTDTDAVQTRSRDAVTHDGSPDNSPCSSTGDKRRRTDHGDELRGDTDSAIAGGATTPKRRVSLGTRQGLNSSPIDGQDAYGVVSSNGHASPVLVRRRNSLRSAEQPVNLQRMVGMQTSLETKALAAATAGGHDSGAADDT